MSPAVSEINTLTAAQLDQFFINTIRALSMGSVQHFHETDSLSASASSDSPANRVPRQTFIAEAMNY